MARPVAILLCMAVVLIAQTTAHFLLEYPPTIGFDDSLEATPPCGSFSVDFSTDNVTDFHVGGDALAMISIHPQATWLFRATLDQTAAGNWTTLRSAIQQTGLGAYCEPDVTVPATFAGSKGVIQIVQDAPDGILYQCAAVNFVAGTIAAPSICSNVTGLSAVYTTDAALSNLPTTATSTLTSSVPTGGAATLLPSGTTTSPPSSSSTTAKPSDATTIGSCSGFGAVMWMVMIASAALVARLL